ncbi:MAG: DNA-directed RNA polymerase subunit alpha [Candidatus Harrisonbacteria bacterium]|nr:DNA-directed RNA polymerase subunit alpha [Candidatus Harrisonbacteria bacterium]
MKITNISEALQIKKVKETATTGEFEIEGLYTGYGITIGSALRRVLYSSLKGAAITRIKLKDVNHEFSTLPGMVEDVVELLLNLKKIRFTLHSEEPQVLSLKVKGEKEVTAGDIKVNSEVEVINPEAHIAQLSNKSAELDMEITVENGLGYRTAESMKTEKLPVGVIVLDAIFSPIIKANFTVQNMRVGDRTDYNKVLIQIETDGSTSPSEALHKACTVLQEHFQKISLFEITSSSVSSSKKEKKK